MSTIERIIEEINLLNATMHLMRTKKETWNERASWYCQMELKAEGMEISVKKNGASAEEALEEAWSAFHKMVFKGAPREMMPGLLAGPRSESKIDDDIPF